MRGLMQERVYIVETPVGDTSRCDPAASGSDLKQRLIDTWASISQNVIDKAVGQWRKLLCASRKTRSSAKKLSYRKEAARCRVLLSILVSR